MRQSGYVAIAATIFLGACLLFQIQPMIARFVLPWFGGSPAVWTSAMLFFQVMLLVGYGYTHLIVGRLVLRRQCQLHIGLLVLSLLLLPVTPGDAGRPVGGDAALPQLLGVLLVSVGVPYVLLASTSPLLQAWFARSDTARSPYWLFALSNLGSLLGLLAYPFLVEPALGLVTQTRVWSAAYALFVVASGAVAVLVLRAVGTEGESGEARGGGAAAASAEEADEERPGGGQRLLWLLLSAGGVVMLLAATNQLCKDVAVIPMLWVLPLALYLLSFIVAFGRPQWYQRWFWTPVLFVSLAGIAVLLNRDFAADELHLYWQIAIYSAGVFGYCVVCHGELYRLRPAASQLTSFYLFVSLGGALGGVLVAVVAPLVLPGYWEFHFILLLVPLGLFAIAHRSAARMLPPAPMRAVVVVWFGAVAMAAMALGAHVGKQRDDAVYAERSFYGVLRVYETTSRRGRVQRFLRHGRIEHGAQYIEDRLRRRPLSYYGTRSGASLGIAAARDHGLRTTRSETVNVGIIGLGVGSIAAYGRHDDRFRFYEIDAAVERIAREHFYFLEDARADTQVVLGDARISLENEPPQGYHVLLVDAFSGDGIPVHLLTAEAMDVYRSHLADGGLVAFHVSNFHFDLRPVVLGLAEYADMDVSWIDDEGPNVGEDPSDWMIVHERGATARSLDSFREPLPEGMEGLLWTDDHADVLGALWD